MKKRLWLAKVAWLTMLVMVGPILLGSMLSNVSIAQVTKPTIAVVQVVDSSGRAGVGLGETVRKALLLALGADRSLSLVTDGNVAAAVSAVKPGEPASLEELVAIGKALEGVDYVLAAEVQSVSVDGGKGRAEVRVATRWVSGRSEREAVRTLVAGRSSVGAAAGGQEEALISQAAEDAARGSVQEGSQNLGVQGGVTSVFREKEGPLVSLGGEDGVRQGAELAVLSRGREIARLVVTGTERLMSKTRVISSSGVKGIRAGDQVALVYNPSLTIEGAKPAVKKPSALRNVGKWIVALGLVWLLTREKAGVAVSSLEIIPPVNTTLPADGTTTLAISARLLDANNRPVPVGTKVDFSLAAQPPGTGSVGSIISPVSTDQTGLATTTLTAGTAARTVRVTAAGGGQSGHIDIQYASGTAKYISLARDPSTIDADGVTASTIRATVTDVAGNNVLDGALVSFSTNVGTIVPTQVGTVGGVATSFLTSTVGGTATVTATSGEASNVVNVTLTTVAVTGPGSMMLSAVPNPTFLGTNGVATATITATLRDAVGGLVPAGTSVDFSTSLGSVTATALTVGTTGTAAAQFTSVFTGQAVITATSGTVTSAITVTVNPGAARTVTLAADPSSVEANGNNFSTITATVRDASGNLVADGTEVRFSAVVAWSLLSGGTWASGEHPVWITASSRTTGGLATALLVSRNPVTDQPSLPGAVTVTARVEAQAPPLPSPSPPIENSAGLVQFVSQRVAYIAVGADPLNIRGLDWVGHTSTIRADVFDVNHNPVADGTAVYFSSDRGMISGNGPSVGGVATSFTSRGTALATLTSEADGNYDPAFNGLVTIRVVAGGAPGDSDAYALEAPDLVIFSGPALPEPQSFITLSKTTLHSVGDAMTIIITVRDRNGNPVVDDTDISVAADLGTLDSTSLRTRRGMAHTVLRTSIDATAPTALGTGHVHAIVESDPVSVLLPTDPADGEYTVVP